MLYLHNLNLFALPPEGGGRDEEASPFQQPISVTVQARCDAGKGPHLLITSRVYDTLSKAAFSYAAVYEDRGYNQQVEVSNSRYVNGRATDIIYLPQGNKTYYVQVYAADTVTYKESIFVPACSSFLKLSFIKTDTSGYGAADGTVTLAATGGVGPYQFRLNNNAYQSGASFSGLAAGNYTFGVVDGAGDTASMSVVIAQPSAANGTLLRTACNGYNLQQVLADGNGGERWGNVVAYDSPSCGVVFGCSDPEAGNYNPAATHNDGTCTYVPKVYTEVKTIEVRGCAPGGVYLRWYNHLGGIDSHLFAGKTDRPFSAEVTSEYTEGSGLRATAIRNGAPGMVLRTANLNLNQYQVVCGVFTSPLVWLHHASGKTEQVYVVPATVGAQPAGKKSYDLSVEISLTPPNSLKQ